MMRRALRPLVAIVAGLALVGCAYSMIDGRTVRAEPLRDAVERTAAARGIRPDGPIDVKVVDRPELHAILEDALLERRSPELLADYARALTALGLWPAERDLLDEALAVYGEEVVGLYVPSRRGLYLIEDTVRPPVSVRIVSALARRDLMNEFSLTHEIVHLLQHQAYPELLEPDGIPLGHDDLETAVQAAVEGDAMRYGFAAMEMPLPPPDTLIEDVQRQQASREGSALSSAPALIRLSMDFPYSYGYALAYHEGPLLLDRPPISSEQVLHEERRYEPFLYLHLDERSLPPACRVLERNGVGELALSILFRDLSPDPPANAWDGWHGDRYVAAECAGRDEFVWWTAWDTEADAAEFQDAYAGIAAAVARRAGHSVEPTTRRRGRFVVVASSGLAQLADEPPPATTRVGDLPELLSTIAP